MRSSNLGSYNQFLEFWETGICPFALPHPQSVKPEPQSTTTTTTTEPTTKPDNGNHSPYL